MLNTSVFAVNVGWRLSFVLGAILGLAVPFVRRNVPERAHAGRSSTAREREAEQVVREIEQDVQAHTRAIPEPEASRSKSTCAGGFPARDPELGRLDAPRRRSLGLAPFIGQAFL